MVIKLNFLLFQKETKYLSNSPIIGSGRLVANLPPRNEVLSRSIFFPKNQKKTEKIKESEKNRKI